MSEHDEFHGKGGQYFVDEAGVKTLVATTKISADEQKLLDANLAEAKRQAKAANASTVDAVASEPAASKPAKTK